MDISQLAQYFDQEVFMYVVLPLLIFIARVIDQSIGILRIIFATKGMSYLALFAGFFESFIWLIAVSQIINHLDNIFTYLAFAGGFSFGNFLGIFIEKKLLIGNVMIRVVFQKDSEKSINLLKENGFRLTVVDAQGMENPVKMLFSTMPRKQIKSFIDMLNINNPNAFYTIEDVRVVREGFLNKARLNI